MAYRAKRTVIHRFVSPSAGDNSHLNQAQSNQQNYNTGNQRSDDIPHILECTAYNHLDRRTSDTSTEHHRQSAHHPRSNNRPDKRETCSLNAQKTGPQRSKAPALDKGGYAGSEQRHRNQEPGCLQIQLQRIRYNQRRSNNRHKNGQ